MINGPLRPWGKVPWVFNMPSLAQKEWLILGGITTQDRSQAIVRHCGTSIRSIGCRLIEVDDSDSAPTDFSRRSREKIEANLRLILGLNPRNIDFVKFKLLDPLVRLQTAVQKWIAESAGNIVFDVSTLPERFCFPVLRWLIESKDVKSLAITYMLAERYTVEDLGYDSQDWGQLPTFVSEQQPSGSVDQVIVGVGFLPYSLPDWLKKTYNRPPLQNIIAASLSCFAVQRQSGLGVH